MKFKIHFTTPSGDDDSIVIEGETVEELREQAEIEVSSRNGTDPWSEEIK